MPDQSPLSGAEEWVAFDIGCACAGSETTVFILDEEFADKGFTKTVVILAKETKHSYENN